MRSLSDFLKWEEKSHDTIDFKMTYVDMAGGDVLAGLLLSQIVFWHLPNKQGQDKLKVVKEESWWLARGDGEWFDEIRLTYDQARRARGVLVKLGLIESRNFKFNGAPKTHIRIQPEAFLTAWQKQLDLGSSPSPLGNKPKSIWAETQVDLGSDPSSFGFKPESLTETTAKTTTENTTETTSESVRARTTDTPIPGFESLAEPTPKTGKAKKQPDAWDPDGFVEVCQQHPNVATRSQALTEWNRQKPDKAAVLQDIAWRKMNDKDWLPNQRGETFVQHLRTYLFNRRWEEERKPTAPKPGQPPPGPKGFQTREEADRAQRVASADYIRSLLEG